MKIKKTNSYQQLEALNGGPLKERHVRRAGPEDGIDAYDGDGDPIYLRHPEVPPLSGPEKLPARPPEVIPRHQATGVLLRAPAAPFGSNLYATKDYLPKVWHHIAPGYACPSGLESAGYPDYHRYGIYRTGAVDDTYRPTNGSGYRMSAHLTPESRIPRGGLSAPPNSKMVFYRISEPYISPKCSVAEFKVLDADVSNSFGIIAEQRCYSIVSPLKSPERLPHNIRGMPPSRVLAQGTNLGSEYRSFYQITDDKLLFLVGWQGYLLHNRGTQGVAVEEVGWMGYSDGRGWSTEPRPRDGSDAEEALRFFLFCDKAGVDGKPPRVQFIVRAVHFHNNPAERGGHIRNIVHRCVYPDNS
jgi:hypothetical protein